MNDMTPILVRFMLDRDALTPPPEDKNIHMRFLKAWESYGILLDIDTKNGSSRIKNTIDTMHVRFRKYWETALIKHLRDFIPPSLPELESIDKVENLRDFSGKTHLLCLEDVKADLLAIEAGLNDYDGFFQPKNLTVEITRLKDIDICSAFERARSCTQQIIPKGVSVNDVWRNNFLPLVDMHKNIFILDAYAMEEHWRSILNTFSQQSGLQKMVREIGAHKMGHSLKLFTSSNSQMKHQDIVDMLKDMLDRFNRGGIKSLKVGSIDERSFANVHHERHVVFDLKRVCTLGKGLTILSGENLKQNLHLSFSTETEDVKVLKRLKETFESKFESESQPLAILSTVFDSGGNT